MTDQAKLLRLITEHGDSPDGSGVVAMLDPAPYYEPDGSLPNVIVYEGRRFERGWTNDGPSDERLWFEVEEKQP